MTDETQPTGRSADGRFGPGNPGKPPGARNRLQAQLSRMMLADFALNHPQVMAKLRYQHTLDYVKLMMAVAHTAEADLEEGDAPLAPLDLETLAERASNRAAADLSAKRMGHLRTDNLK